MQEIVVFVMQMGSQAPKDPIRAEFSRRGGTIGRDPEKSTLHLVDPDNKISRVHAEVIWRSNGFYLVPRSPNPTRVNGTLVYPNEEFPLHVGDEIEIGHYRLKVDTQIGEGMRNAGVGYPERGGPSITAELDELLAGPDAHPKRDPTPVSFNPFSELDSQGNAKGMSGDSAPASRGMNLRPNLGEGETSSFEDLLPRQGSKPADHGKLSAPGSNSRPLANAKENVIPVREDVIPKGSVFPADGLDDPFLGRHPVDIGGGPQRQITPPSNPPRENSPEPPTQPSAIEPLQLKTPPNAKPDSPDTLKANEALLKALLEGLGLSDLSIDNLSPDVMKRLGALTRQMIQGSIELLRARAATKMKLKADVTIISNRRNNPFKFAADADHALKMLLIPPSRGFMSSDDAVKEVYADLQQHEALLLSGAKAALTYFLKQLDPKVLEAKADEDAGSIDFLPGIRANRQYKLYKEAHQALARLSEDDFEAFLGKVFGKDG